MRVIRHYKAKVKETGESAKDVLGEKNLMVSRVQNAIVQEVSQEIKDTYRGEAYIWLPSTAAVPDETHQQNYGLIFVIGKGEQPGERFGCQCGMEILVKERTLAL